MISTHEFDSSLLVSSGKRFSNVRTRVLHHFVNRTNNTGLYLTLNYPYKTLATHLRSHAINPKQLLVIDAVSFSLNAGREKGRCVYVTPSKRAILTALRRFIENEHKFIIVDSLPLLELYLGERQAKECVKQLLRHSAKKECHVSFLTVASKEHADIISFTKQRCAQTIVF